MIKTEYVRKDTETGLEYIQGKDKVLFENGVIISNAEMEANRGNIGNLMRDRRLIPEYCGYDYAYAKTTGIIRKKAVHKPIEVPVINEKVQPKDNSPKKPRVEMHIHRPRRNWFDWIYPKIMPVISVICSVLSVYFTGSYMMELQPAVISYFISVCMLLYGLVGTQMARRAFKSGQFLRAFIFGVTSFCTIGFSMYTALDVNYKKYVSSHEVIVREEKQSAGNALEYGLIMDEMQSNKAQIESLSKTYVVMWDGEKKSNVVVEGKVTEKAQNQINELTERNRELNERLIELAHDGAATEEKQTEKAKTLSGLLGALLGVSGNIVQMLILLLPSIFIDLVNVLSITIYNDSYSKEE